MLDGPAGPFKLVAKADRIDHLSDGRLAIIDYKTGGVPAKGDLERGLAPQLPLEAMMVARGGFKDVPVGDVAKIAFWRLSGGSPVAEIKSYDAPQFAADAYHGLLSLIVVFDDPTTPYLARPRAAYAPRFSDYEHLARVKEWSASGDEGEDA